MKTLIFQSLIPLPNIDKKKEEIYNTCCSTVKRYAENIGSDYEINTTSFFPGLPPHFDCFRVFQEPRFLEYDKVLFIDADVFALDTNKNIFQYYNGFCACANPGGKVKRREYKEFGDGFLNSGIILFTPEVINKLKPFYRQTMKECVRLVPGRDQLALNRLAFKHLGGYTKIDPNHACYLSNEQSKQAILVHMAGRNRQTYIQNQQEWDSHFGVNT